MTKIERLKQRIAHLEVVVEKQAALIAGLQGQPILCRVCEMAQATGDDGLCDGCRQARIARRL